MRVLKQVLRRAGTESSVPYLFDLEGHSVHQMKQGRNSLSNVVGLDIDKGERQV